MKSLMVTGGCGFIGANFLRYLLDESGYEGMVVNLDALTYAGNPLSVQDLAERHPGRYRFVRADICDGVAVGKALDEFEVDVICHFAAESHVDRSISGPADFVRTNIMGTYQLLELARQRKGRLLRFHHVSTDEVFGSLGATGFFREDTAYRPNSPYSASKAASDHLVRSYHATYGLPVTVSNCSNNYGPYQFPEKLIPLMILNGLGGKPLPVYGDGMNVRDWLYVRDHCAAIWRILEAGVDGETYNVGGRCEMRNIEVVGMVCDLLDERVAPPSGLKSRRELITFVKDRPGHDRRYAIDSSKIERGLCWVPEESFETGIGKAVDWYLANPEWVRSVQTGEYRQWIERHYGTGAEG
jgi:dTDP-glucose 4,6-dehydratase